MIITTNNIINTSKLCLLVTMLILLISLGAGGAAATPVNTPTVFVIAVPRNPGADTAKAVNQLLDRLWPRLVAGVVVEVWNATDNVRIARIEPRGNREQQERTRGQDVGAVRRFLNAVGSAPVTETTDDAPLFAFLREFGSVVRNTLPTGDVQVLVIGRAQSHDPRSPSFSMRGGSLLPSDDHILASPAVTPYGTAGRTTSLAGTKLHVCHTEQAADWASEPARLGTSRFYALFVQAMGGQLGTFTALGGGCFDRFLAGTGSPETHTLRPTGKLVMYPAAHRPVEVGAPPPPPAPLPTPDPRAACKVAAMNRPVDVALLVDATSSMRHVIAEVRQNIARLVDYLRSLAPTSRLSVIAFRDFGDEFVVRPSPFASLDAAGVETLTRFVMQLKAAGGGDDPEAIDAALEVAVALPWRTGVASRVIVITDATVRSNSENAAIEFARSFARSGPDRRVFVVETGSARHPFLQKLAVAGDGQHFTYQGHILESLFPAITGCSE